MPNLRNATAEDAQALAALESGATDHPWTCGHYLDSIDQHHCLVLESGGDIVGTLVYSRVVDEAELLNVVIHAGHKGKGWGRHLMEELIARNRGLARSIFLEVRTSNNVAHSLYRQMGFHTVGVRKNYYPVSGGREDAIVMRYDFPQSEQGEANG